MSEYVSRTGADTDFHLTFLEKEKAFDPHSVYTTDQQGNPLPPRL